MDAVYTPAKFTQVDVNKIGKLAKADRYFNRSDAIRDLVRKGLMLFEQEARHQATKAEGGGKWRSAK